jgi:hypothetical protein
MYFEKCCCFVGAGAFPPGGSKGDGLPCIACCNYRCGGEDEIADLEDVPSETKILLDNTFLCAYCCCYGGGYLGPACGFCGPNCGNGDGPCCKGTCKFCCLHSNHETAPCHGDNGCCYQKQKLCCIVSGWACPPGGGKSDGLPICACCGKHCGGEEEETYDYAEEEAPEQEMM